MAALNCDYLVSRDEMKHSLVETSYARGIAPPTRIRSLSQKAFAACTLTSNELYWDCRPSETTPVRQCVRSKRAPTPLMTRPGGPASRSEWNSAAMQEQFLPCPDFRSLCRPRMHENSEVVLVLSSAVSAISLGLMPAVMFVTGSLMYWNRSLGKKWLALRQTGRPKTEVYN